MAYLLDTSILSRMANAMDAQHAVAAKAVLQVVQSPLLLQAGIG